jgi:hypothetical protein
LIFGFFLVVLMPQCLLCPVFYESLGGGLGQGPPT